jgi:hypothetical protein
VASFSQSAGLERAIPAFFLHLNAFQIRSARLILAVSIRGVPRGKVDFSQDLFSLVNRSHRPGNGHRDVVPVKKKGIHETQTFIDEILAASQPSRRLAVARFGRRERLRRNQITAGWLAGSASGNRCERLRGPAR